MEKRNSILLYFLGVVKWYHPCFGSMWRKFDSCHRDQYFWADSDNGSTGALQAFSRGSIPRRSTKFGSVA